MEIKDEIIRGSIKYEQLVVSKNLIIFPEITQGWLRGKLENNWSNFDISTFNKSRRDGGKIRAMIPTVIEKNPMAPPKTNRFSLPLNKGVKSSDNVAEMI